MLQFQVMDRSIDSSQHCILDIRVSGALSDCSKLLLRYGIFGDICFSYNSLVLCNLYWGLLFDRKRHSQDTAIDPTNIPSNLDYWFCNSHLDNNLHSSDLRS